MKPQIHFYENFTGEQVISFPFGIYKVSFMEDTKSYRMECISKDNRINLTPSLEYNLQNRIFPDVELTKEFALDFYKQLQSEWVD